MKPAKTAGLSPKAGADLFRAAGRRKKAPRAVWTRAPRLSKRAPYIGPKAYLPGAQEWAKETT